MHETRNVFSFKIATDTHSRNITENPIKTIELRNKEMTVTSCLHPFVYLTIHLSSPQLILARHFIKILPLGKELSEIIPLKNPYGVWIQLSFPRESRLCCFDDLTNVFADFND